MMDDHYGLRGRPFQLTPDPRFWYDTATHGKAMAYLGYGLSQGEGFVVITGDPGAGKTTLMGHLLGELDGERLNVVKIVSTHLRADDLLRLVAQGLGLAADGLSKAALLSAIEHGLHAIARAGRRTLLVVDEAQALPGESLDELRMLSNFQAGGYPLLQIFLLGQPEFRLVLQQPEFEQLRQRVIAMHHLAPMEVEEVEAYLMHRLHCVGWQGRPRFTTEAMAAMHRWSGGIPRRLNQLASRVLLYGAVEQIENFGAPDIAAVIDDIEQESVVEEGAPEPVAVPEPTRPGRVAELRTPPAGSAETRALERRVAELEAQVASQSDALRRVLGLLVDWVEKDEGRSGIDLAALRGSAA
jgi:putative secretion ATPase (PEP-CTERM system associated)